MKIFDKLNMMNKNMDIFDTGLTKWSVFFFTLMIVKFWPVLLTLEWYYYLVIFIVLVARPLYHFFK